MRYYCAECSSSNVCPEIREDDPFSEYAESVCASCDNTNWICNYCSKAFSRKLRKRCRVKNHVVSCKKKRKSETPVETLETESVDFHGNDYGGNTWYVGYSAGTSSVSVVASKGSVSSVVAVPPATPSGDRLSPLACPPFCCESRSSSTDGPLASPATTASCDAVSGWSISCVRPRPIKRHRVRTYASPPLQCNMY